MLLDDVLLALDVEAAEAGGLGASGPLDPILLLEGTSEEAAAWQQLGELELSAARAHVDRAATIAHGYLQAVRAGRKQRHVLGELMGTLCVSRQAAEYDLREALRLVAHPATARAMREGRLGLRHARALLDVVGPLSADVADAVERAVLAWAAGQPPSRVREMARRKALQLDPDGAARRRSEAAQARRLRVTDAGDGMVEVGILMRAEQGLAVLQRAEAATDATDGTGRTRDQRAADWATEQLLGLGPEMVQMQAGTSDAPEAPDVPEAPHASDAPDVPHAPQAVPGADLVLDGRRRRPVQVLLHIPVTTALGLDDLPGDLDRIGPVDADHARLLLSTAELRKVCVDADTGQVLHVEEDVVRPTASRARIEQLTGEGLLAEQALAQAQAEAVREAILDMVRTPSSAPVGPEEQYRPSAGLSRTVRTASRHCDFPGCNCHSSRCDDEHTVPWPRGATELASLRSRSRWCHQVKQQGWRPGPLPDGSTSWTSACGRSYVTPRPWEPLPSVPVGARLSPPTPPPPRDDAGIEMSPYLYEEWKPPDELSLEIAWLRDVVQDPPVAPALSPQALAPPARWPDDPPF